MIKTIDGQFVPSLKAWMFQPQWIGYGETPQEAWEYIVDQWGFLLDKMPGLQYVSRSEEDDEIPAEETGQGETQ